jgi:NodT family efflux transporter outer membrane factor (OMF) lipoprotein
MVFMRLRFILFHQIKRDSGSTFFSLKDEKKAVRNDAEGLGLAKFRLACMALPVLLLTGCAVGPDFEKPKAPDVQAYDVRGLPATTVGAGDGGAASAAQRFVPGAGIPSEWWVLFRSEDLNRLIEKALQANPDLQAAEAALREAQENVYASEGAFWPSLDGGMNATRKKTSNAGLSAPGGSTPSFSIYNTSVDVSYPLDVFGGIRREVEGVEAQKDVQQFALEAAKITLTSNVVTAAIQEASLRAQIAATQEIADDERKQLGLLKQQFELGGIAKPAVLAQEATLAQTLTALPALEKQLAQTRHQLQALAGRFPSEELDARFTLESLYLPETLPLSLPSQLVEQRPDIQAATAQLHAASAAIGVATANMLPQITLTGSYGLSAVQLASLFAPGSAAWSIGAGLLQPLFRGGELLHQKRASEAAFDKAAAQYRSTVIGAFQNVADTLRALESDADALKAQVAADRSAEDSLKLAREQFKAGATSYLSLLTSEQTRDQARIALVQAQARRFADTAALFQALGGGWWHQKTDDRSQMSGEQGLNGVIKSKYDAPAEAEPPVKKYNFRSIPLRQGFGGQEDQ